MRLARSLGRGGRRVAIGFATVSALALATAAGALAGGILEDYDARSGTVAPTAAQKTAVSAMGARVTWNQFGTPGTLIKEGGWLATGVSGATPVAKARNFLASKASLFKLTAAEVAALELVTDGPMAPGSGNAVTFRQKFGGLEAAEGGLVTVGVRGDRVAFVSSSLTGDPALAAGPATSFRDAWLAAAGNAGLSVSVLDIRSPKIADGWRVFSVRGFAQPQRARQVAVPTPQNGVRPAWEVLLLDVKGGDATAYQYFIDAVTNQVLVRKNLVDQSHPPVDAFEGAVTGPDGSCDADKGPWIVAPGEKVDSIAVAVEALLTTNDSVIHLIRNGTVVASQDTVFSPEALVYDPSDNGEGTYYVRVCDFPDGVPWDPPQNYVGQIVFSAIGPGTANPYPPKWKVFPAYPKIGQETYPWQYPSTDIRQIWCWESTVGEPPVALPECQREVENLASRVPWDYSAVTNTPTFTTVGNNARSGEAWSSPLTPGATAFRPVSPTREYIYPWTNQWHTTQCAPAFVPGVSQDISAAVTNLFVMHNRMHDWTYFLGFTERHWNGQESNFGTGNTRQNDPLTGDAQAGAADGGFPSYLGRDNANMISLPDGVPAITNMYLWQPLAGSFYAPCVDGDYDQAVIGHEFGHMVENRMIGKGGTRGGHHAGAMGESNGDLMAMEYLNENNFVPVSGENPYAVGAYVTGNKQRAIRNYGMNWPREGAFPAPGSSPQVDPLQFGNIGYDITGPQVHADGEIWSATNFDIRTLLNGRYDASFPSSSKVIQTECAEGKRPANLCPGNRRWAQIMFDAYLLMPTAPSMLQARDAYLAADQMRFNGANRDLLWRAFARRGFGEGAYSSNTTGVNDSGEMDTDPTPDHTAPTETEATVVFRARDVATGELIPARIYVGHYEARTSPIADTDPATNDSDPSTPQGSNLDDTAAFVPGTYEFVANSKGFGHVRFRISLAAGTTQTVAIKFGRNVASKFSGATAAGDGTEFDNLIDDTEATNWDRTGAEPNVRGSQVTVDLGGGEQPVRQVNVSAMLHAGQNRFTALRSFEIWTCTASFSNSNCTAPGAFTKLYTSPANTFPGFNPRPVAPELLLRSFDVPDTTATHVRIVVTDNQCTGNPKFQGEQDADPTNGTDCREGSPGGSVNPIFGDLPQVLAPRDNEVHIAELQVLSRLPEVVVS